MFTDFSGCVIEVNVDFSLSLSDVLLLPDGVVLYLVPFVLFHQLEESSLFYRCSLTFKAFIINKIT